MGGVKVKWDERRGVWYARPYLGRTPDGKVIQPRHEFPEAQSEEEAQELANAWASNLTANGLVKSALLVDLLNDYSQFRQLNGASPNTIANYWLFTRYVSRFLPSANARDLGSLDFSRFEQRLLVPKAQGGQGLSRNSVRNVHDFLHGAYRYFVTYGICDSNPLASVTKPRLEQHEAQTLNIGDFRKLDAQLKALLEPSSINPKTYRNAMNAFAAWLALRTGMRVGEVCAVRDCDVFRSAKYVHVGGNVVEESKKKPYRRDATKGRKNRNVSITDTDIAAIDAFIALRTRHCGALQSDSPIVTFDGGYCRPRSVSRAFSSLARKSDMPKGFTFHDLRHTHASWLLTNGVDLQTVSERLGHRDAATTARIYAHVLPGRDAYAATTFEQAANAAETVEKVLQ